MSEPVNGWLSESQQRVWRSYLLAKTHIEEYLEEALRDFGPCPVHRRTFRGVREFCADRPALAAATQLSLWPDPAR